MIIVEVMGGLGNQMQQYALYRKLESLGKDARLDVSWFLDKERQTKVLASRKLELSWFENLPAKYCTQEEKQAILGKNNLIGKLKKKLLGVATGILRKATCIIRKSLIWRMPI